MDYRDDPLLVRKELIERRNTVVIPLEDFTEMSEILTGRKGSLKFVLFGIRSVRLANGFD